MSLNLLKKGLILAHLNICSLRNKVHEMATICSSSNIHVVALTETHLDTTFNDSELCVKRYRLYRRDRDRYGGGVAFYFQEHIPVLRKGIRCKSFCRGVAMLPASQRHVSSRERAPPFSSLFFTSCHAGATCSFILRLSCAEKVVKVVLWGKLCSTRINLAFYPFIDLLCRHVSAKGSDHFHHRRDLPAAALRHTLERTDPCR
jgi:hypothetical protein